MPLDAHGQPTTKVCGCGRVLGRTARRCSGCGHVFRWQQWEGRVTVPVAEDRVEITEVVPVISADVTDRELLLEKLRAIGLPEIMKWEALARRYAVAHYRQDHAG